MDKHFLGITFFILIGLAAYGQDQKALIVAGDKFYGKKDYKNALASFLAAQEMNPDEFRREARLGARSKKPGWDW